MPRLSTLEAQHAKVSGRICGVMTVAIGIRDTTLVYMANLWRKRPFPKSYLDFPMSYLDNAVLKSQPACSKQVVPEWRARATAGSGLWSEAKRASGIP